MVFRVLLALSLGLLSAQATHADTLNIPAKAASSVTMPGRGMTMEQVETEFGVPLVKHDTVGEPPITQWEYSGFSVYFESKWVIHSVGKRAQPPQSAPPVAEQVPVETPTDAPVVEKPAQKGDVTVPTLPLRQYELDTTYPLPQ